jgi:hypothetical protein
MIGRRKRKADVLGYGLEDADNDEDDTAVIAEDDDDGVSAQFELTGGSQTRSEEDSIDNLVARFKKKSCRKIVAAKLDPSKTQVNRKTSLLKLCEKKSVRLLKWT